MKIVLGSLNKAKQRAVEKCFPNDHVIAKHVDSGVSKQPLSDHETREGAIHRAQLAQKFSPTSIGIGLEGGVMLIEGEPYLCNWGALVATGGTVFTAAGARIKLPNTFTSKLEKGLELSDIMDDYVNKKHIRHHEGAIGIFTNGQIMRSDMFVHVIKLLKGQMEYSHVFKNENVGK